MESAPGPFKVLVDDNFHFMDESERRCVGTFSTLESAVAACEEIVDRFLSANVKPGMTPAGLLSAYKAFGDDPFIVCPARPGWAPFSAWAYAEKRVHDICATNRE